MTAPFTHTRIPAGTTPATGTDPGSLRNAWRAIRGAVSEMNYAAQLLAEPRTTPPNRTVG